MSYRPVVDKDEEFAKECLDCGKFFYVGNECPFCVVTIMHCAKCGKAKVDKADNKWTTPLIAIKDALKFDSIYDQEEAKKIKHINIVCEDCKAEDLCKTRPIAVCTER